MIYKIGSHTYSHEIKLQPDKNGGIDLIENGYRVC